MLSHLATFTEFHKTYEHLLALLFQFLHNISNKRKDIKFSTKHL
jgi:hypothetical protein